MKVIGFGLTKQFAEKLIEPQNNFSVNTGINIKDIQPAKVDFLRNEEALSFSFELKISYEKDIAKLSFNGNVLVAMDKKSASDVLKKWKDKKIPDLVRISLFNFIMARCTVKALQFEEEFNLPKHIQIPQFRGEAAEPEMPEKAKEKSR
ncbi:hypothetical protein J4447_03890 [Candidatus Pacearchaeota archaeon]|nr:hypothetical protein [Candidatus Pacearchaeota archaeon]